jgi:hypothetical protein
MLRGWSTPQSQGKFALLGDDAKQKPLPATTSCGPYRMRKPNSDRQEKLERPNLGVAAEEIIVPANDCG